jgi:hypothetical protein
MKVRMMIYMSILVLSATILIADDVTKETSGSPYGTWVNEKYKTFGGRCTFNSDGTGSLYKQATDKNPIYECRIIIEDSWFDAEGHIYYKALFLFDTIPYDEPVRREPWLIRLNPSGDVLEKATYGSERLGYPEEVNPTSSGAYSIYYRQ